MIAQQIVCMIAGELWLKSRLFGLEIWSLASRRQCSPPAGCGYNIVMTKSPRISFVVPAMDEQDSIEELHRQIDQVCKANQYRYEIVFVDDGSRDRTWRAIEQLSGDHDNVIGIRFRRNFGKAAALSAGFAEATGEIVVTMDADLQDDPKEVPRMLAKLDEGFDLVSGWKKIRHDPWHKLLPSKVFNALVSRITGVMLHDHNCGFKAYRESVTSNVSLYGERHRFIPVLAAAKGFRVGEIDVEHHARPFGESKYGVSRLIKGFLDLITVYLLTGFGGRPLHLIGTVGLLSLASGGLGMFYLSAMWVLTRVIQTWEVLHLHQTAIFYYCILATILGAQCLLAGLLAELFVSSTVRHNSMYNVVERAGPGRAGPNRSPSNGDVVGGDERLIERS